MGPQACRHRARLARLLHQRVLIRRYMMQIRVRTHGLAYQVAQRHCFIANRLDALAILNASCHSGASGLGTSSGFGLFGTPAWGFRYGSNMPLPKVENVRPLCMDFYKQGFCNRRGPHNQGCLFRHDEIEGKGKIEQPAKAIPPEVMLFGMEAQGVLHKAGTNTLSEVTKAAKQWAESRKTEIEAEEKVAADMQAAMEQASAGAGQDATQTPVGARAPLPAGWKEAKAPDGRVYYYNSVTKATMWTRPTGELGKAPPPLPPGWKEAHAPDGRTYFYHAETKATSWKRPEAPQLDDADKEPGAEEAELDTAATEAGAESARMLESNDNSAPLEGDAPPMAESAHDVPQSPDGAVEAPQANQEAIANEVSLDDKGDEPEAKRARAK